VIASMLTTSFRTNHYPAAFATVFIVMVGLMAAPAVAQQTSPLTISTVPPLFTGIVGSAYSQTFLATGGTSPYAWTIRQQVPGLTLNRTTGVLAGTPEQAGAYALSVQVTDSAGATVTKEFTLTIEQPPLLISNSSQLPSATVGTAYQHRFLATGGRAPYTWLVTSGSVPGLTLNSSTGILSSTPTSAGTFTFNVTVRDSANATATRPFNLTVEAGQVRLSSLPGNLQNTIGNPFSVSLSASGGSPPYTWSANGLPEGLQIDAASGTVSGTFRSVGTFLFTIRVTDAARATATELITVEVSAPPLPNLRVIEAPDVSEAARQISTRVQMSAPYSLPLNGQLILSFAPETGLGDPAVQFSSGGRTVDFQVPAGTVEAQFPTASVGLQTGTVAGTITLSVRLQTNGVTLTPTPISIQTIRINRTSPAITSVAFSRTGSTLEVRVTGYSTSREITQGVFRFRASGSNTLTTSELSLPLEDMFGAWYRDSASTQYGGQFTFTQQFTIQGDANAVSPVSVTLTNRVGSTTGNIQ
jgi:Putative Ig domain